MWEYVLYISILVILGYLYENHIKKQDKELESKKDDLIQQFLMNQTSLKDGKPIVWVHIPHEINSRNWINFGSRNSKHLNNPYLYVTIKSIINSCGDKYNVCLIDDTSFTKLMPKWSIQISDLAEPIKGHLRSLAMMKVLYTYGGIAVPCSYLSLTNIDELVERKQHSMFVLEENVKSVVSTYVDYFPSHYFMGCDKECDNMKEYIEFTERLVSRDFTSEMDFLGEMNRKLFELQQHNKISVIDGKLIGIKDASGKRVYIDELCGTSYIDFDTTLKGIYIPSDDVNKRIKYQWFGRLSPEQIIESDMIISKYMHLAK